jgi:hypothetical protein
VTADEFMTAEKAIRRPSGDHAVSKIRDWNLASAVHSSRGFMPLAAMR